MWGLFFEIVVFGGGGAVLALLVAWFHITYTYASLIKKANKEMEAIEDKDVYGTRNPGIFGFNAGYGPLHIAAENDDVETLQALIRNRIFYYEGALEETSRRSSWQIQFFFYKTLSRKSEHWVSGTPLHFACHCNSVGAVVWLLDHGAFPNSLDDYGHTPLHYAVANRNIEIIRLLLSKGGQPHAVATSQEEDFVGRWDEKTPLDIARTPEIIELLQREEHRERINYVCEDIFSQDIESHILTDKEENELDMEKRLDLSMELERKLRKEDDTQSHDPAQYITNKYDILDMEHYGEYYDPDPSILERLIALKKYGYDPSFVNNEMQILNDDYDTGTGVLNLKESLVDEEKIKLVSTGREQFDKYEDQSSGIEEIVNWNERFQSSVQSLRILNKTINSTEDQKINVLTELIHLEKDFLHCAETYGKIIISEYYLDEEQKTIKPSTDYGGIAGGDKYIVHNILFKLAIDSKKLFGSDAAAMKIGGHELNGLANFWNCNIDVCLPLMALVDYRGFRIIAVSLLPIHKGTLVYGSSDAGHTVHSSCDTMNNEIEKAAKRMNIKPHWGGTFAKNKEWLYTATDIEGHIGTDGRLYIIDFSRTFPPEFPNPKFQRGHVYRLLRSEFVKSNKVPLCSDAFSNFIIHDESVKEHNQEVYDATVHLLEEVILQYAKKLPVQVIDTLQENQLPKFSVTSSIHREGINCRMLGFVRNALDEGQATCRSLLLVEMVSRTIKNDIRFRLRETSKQFKIPLEEPYRKMLTKYLNLVFGNGTQSIRYWNEFVKPGVCDYFYLALEKSEYDLDLKQQLTDFTITTQHKNKRSSSELIRTCDGRFLVLMRLSKMLGLSFRSKSSRYLKWFNNHKAVKEKAIIFQSEDVTNIGQRVKHINIVDYAQGYIYKDRGHYYERTESEDAKKYFKKSYAKFQLALESNPYDKEILTTCADLLTRIHGYGSARHNKLPAGVKDLWVKTVFEYFNRALDIDNEDPRTLFHFANFLRYWRNDIDQAEDYYLRALKINPNYVSCLREYGNMLSKERGETELGQKFYDRAKTILEIQELYI